MSLGPFIIQNVLNFTQFLRKHVFGAPLSIYTLSSLTVGFSKCSRRIWSQYQVTPSLSPVEVAGELYTHFYYCLHREGRVMSHDESEWSVVVQSAPIIIAYYISYNRRIMSTGTVLMPAWIYSMDKKPSFGRKTTQAGMQWNVIPCCWQCV